ncbi:MAG: hypothetical protein ACKVT0_22070 [Planctomycetaceae bacterium]
MSIYAALITMSLLCCDDHPSSKTTLHSNRVSVQHKVNKIDSEEDFLGAILEQAFEDLVKQLKVEGELEKKLLIQALKTKSISKPDSITILLFNPNARNEEREQHEFRNPDQQFSLKMVKVKSSLVSEPIGIVIQSSIVEGELIVNELFYSFRMGEWELIRN